jgi:TP901 family phage tail tape measure protein
LVASATQLLSEMDKAAKKTRELGSETEKLASKRDAFDKLGKSAMALGTVLAVGVGLAVSRFAEFDKAMSEVQASTHETVANMGSLREAAIEAGASTVFTATEAANAIDEMAKAGVSTADILGGGLSGALDLASAGSLDVADAAQIAATALTQFKLQGSDIPHVADLLAAGAGKAQGSVDDLSQALNQGGLVASQAGQSIEDTTGVLAAFAAAGLIGSDAGTSLKTALIALEKPSTAAQEVMNEYGIDVFDASGHMLDFAGIAGQLQTKLGGLTDETRNNALATIFGTDAVRSASVLYSQGADGIQEWTDKTNDAGYAAETARLKLDNLSGDVEKLGGSFDTALIKGGSGANEMMRGLVQSVTGLVDGFNSLNPVAQGGVTVLAAVTAGALLLGGGFIALVPKIVAAKRAMQELEITGGRVAKGVGKGGALLLALDAVAGGVTAMGAQSTLAADELARVDAAALAKGKNLKDLDALFHDANGNATTFNSSLKTLFSGDFMQNGAWIQGFNGAIDTVTFGITDMTESIDHNKAVLRELGSQLATTAQTDLRGAIAGFKDYVEQTDGSKDSIEALLNAFPDYKAELISLAGEQGKTLTQQELLNLAQGKGADAASCSVTRMLRLRRRVRKTRQGSGGAVWCGSGRQYRHRRACRFDQGVRFCAARCELRDPWVRGGDR